MVMMMVMVMFDSSLNIHSHDRWPTVFNPVRTSSEYTPDTTPAEVRFWVRVGNS